MFKRLLDLGARRRRRAMMAAADAARDSGDKAGAAALYRAATERFPAAFGAWVQLGNMLKDLSRYDEAAAAYDEAGALQPDNADLALQKGHLAKLSGNFAEALKFYEEAAALDPQSEHAAREIRALGMAPAALTEGEPDLADAAALIHRRLQVAFAARPA